MSCGEDSQPQSRDYYALSRHAKADADSKPETGICGIKSEWYGSVLGFIWLHIRQDVIYRSSNACVVGQDNTIFNLNYLLCSFVIKLAKDISAVRWNNSLRLFFVLYKHRVSQHRGIVLYNSIHRVSHLRGIPLIGIPSLEFHIPRGIILNNSKPRLSIECRST